MRNIVLSPSRQDKIQTCPRKFYFNHVLNKSMIEKPSYFVEGEFLHFILEHYYKMKMKGELNLGLLIEIARQQALKLSLTIEKSEELIKLFQEYQLFHQNESWQVLGVEEAFAKVLYEDEKLDLRIIVQGKIDLRVQQQGITILVDHKKISQNRTPVERNNQILTYCFATEARDFIINQIGTQKSLKTKDKFQRPYFNISEHQIGEWMESTIYSAFEIVRCYERNYFPARLTGCNYQGHKCEFYNVCQSKQEDWIHHLKSSFQNHEDHDLMASVSEEE